MIRFRHIADDSANVFFSFFKSFKKISTQHDNIITEDITVFISTLITRVRYEMSTINLTVSEGQAVPRDWSRVNDYILR